MRIGAVVGLTLCLSLTSALCARAQDGEAVFRANCATCHGDPNGPSPVSAPTVAALRRSTPESILNALVNGKMRIQGTPLDDAARRAVAEFLGGRPLHNPLADAAVVRCASPFPPFRGDTEEGDWNGWGNGLGNTRFARRGGLTAAELPRLKLKWAFGYADVTSARAQPALVGNRLFVASDSGEVHALDPRTGCAYWSFRAQATVRTALLVAPYRTPEGGRGWAVFFGDLRANAYALDATSGRPIWNRKADEHPFAAITGALTFHDGRVFVPVQGLNEEVQGGRPQVPSAVPSAAVCRRWMRALALSCGRPIPLATGGRAGRTPQAYHSGGLLAEGSGPRRPWTSVAALSTSAPATATPTRLSR